MKVAIIDYGAGNIASVQNALARLGISGTSTADQELIQNADKVIFPGVGEANSAMKKLKEKKLDQLIPVLRQPVLGICLGMQLMCQYSEERETVGLGIIPANVRKFSSDDQQFRIPHMGWNTFDEAKGPLFSGIEEIDPYVFFVHSYYVEQNPFTSAHTDYILPFSSAVQRDNFFGVQFHPEKSGSTGLRILENFLKL